MQATPVTVSGQGRMPYKWIVALVVVFGSFMSILDQTVVNNALPALQRAFGADLSGVQWTMTAYILTQGVVTPTTAFFADRLGTKRFYIIALTLFTLGSTLCGLAWNLPSLIVFRVVQGIGGAVIFPLAIALLFREFPPQQRGLAASIIGIAALAAPAAGPTLGGYLVTYASWPLIFFINVPLGVLGVLMALILLRREGPSEAQRRFDPLGFVLAACGLAAILYGLSEASNSGWGSTRVLSFLAGGLLILVLFIAIELYSAARGKQPLLDLRIFTNLPFLLSNLANASISLAFFGCMILAPIYLQTLRGLDAFQSGLLTLPLSFASIPAALLAGRVLDRMGPRVVLLPGILLMGISTWLIAQFALDTSYTWIVFVYALRGVGLGLLLQPLTVTALSEMPARQYAQASSLNSVVRFVFTSLGVAILATLVQTQASTHIHTLVQQQHPSSRAALGLLSQEGLNMAVQDGFWLSLAVLVVAGIVVCFVRIRKADATSTGKNTGELAKPVLIAAE